MSLLLLTILASLAQAQDCAQPGSCSLMELLNDMERATSSQDAPGDGATTGSPPVQEDAQPVQREQPRAYISTEQEYAPVQRAAAGLPPGSAELLWQSPSAYTYWVAFAGTPGRKAKHEGVDHVHTDPKVAEVPVVAMADGEVVYVRLGCPQSAAFGKNRSARECGSGWGNHVVVHHGGGIYTRYAHLDPDGVGVGVGDTVRRGEQLGLMGNSGRSETRHLHYELGTMASGFDPDAPAQSFDAVYDPRTLPTR
jgi:murein DD-endopeptidase MepM/ murein hydrolase activator NlpD